MNIAITCHQAKFTQNAAIASCLLATGDTILVEASPNDKLWGIGFSMFDSNILSKKPQWGENIQGKSLMNVRKSIRDNSGN